MVALDCGARPAPHTDAFDYIRIQRPLRQEISPASARGFLLEYINKQPPNRLSLCLRIINAVERSQEQVRCIPMDQPDVEPVSKGPHHLLGFALAQQPRIDKNATKLLAKCLMDQHRGDRGVDAPR